MLAQEFSEAGTKVRVNSVAPLVTYFSYGPEVSFLTKGLLPPHRGIFPSEMTTQESGGDQKSAIDATGYREKKGIPAGRPGARVCLSHSYAQFEIGFFSVQEMRETWLRPSWIVHATSRAALL